MAARSFCVALPRSCSESSSSWFGFSCILTCLCACSISWCRLWTGRRQSSAAAGPEGLADLPCRAGRPCRRWRRAAGGGEASPPGAPFPRCFGAGLPGCPCGHQQAEGSTPPSSAGSLAPRAGCAALSRPGPATSATDLPTARVRPCQLPARRTP